MQRSGARGLPILHRQYSGSAEDVCIVQGMRELVRVFGKYREAGSEWRVG